MKATWQNRCAARSRFGNVIPPHEPAPLDEALRDSKQDEYALDSRPVEGGAVSMRVCKHCGCLYLDVTP